MRIQRDTQRHRLTYDEYWSNRGSYGEERVRRKNIRKKKRIEKLLCPKCGLELKSRYRLCNAFDSNDRDERVYGLRCRCCPSCRVKCMMDD